MTKISAILIKCICNAISLPIEVIIDLDKYDDICEMIGSCHIMRTRCSKYDKYGYRLSFFGCKVDETLVNLDENCRNTWASKIANKDIFGNIILLNGNISINLEEFEKILAIADIQDTNITRDDPITKDSLDTNILNVISVDNNGDMKSISLTMEQINTITDKLICKCIDNYQLTFFYRDNHSDINQIISDYVHITINGTVIVTNDSSPLSVDELKKVLSYK